jgi:hypothetical protein
MFLTLFHFLSQIIRHFSLQPSSLSQGGNSRAAIQLIYFPSDSSRRWLKNEGDLSEALEVKREISYYGALLKDQHALDAYKEDALRWYSDKMRRQQQVNTRVITNFVGCKFEDFSFGTKANQVDDYYVISSISPFNDVNVTDCIFSNNLMQNPAVVVSQYGCLCYRECVML